MGPSCSSQSARAGSRLPWNRLCRRSLAVLGWKRQSGTGWIWKPYCNRRCWAPRRRGRWGLLSVGPRAWRTMSPGMADDVRQKVVVLATANPQSRPYVLLDEAFSR